VPELLDTLEGFFEAISPAELEDETYEITTPMSESLLRVFGSTKASGSAPSDWVAPSKSGLHNSEPIIRTEKNVAPPVAAESKWRPDDSAAGAKFGGSAVADSKDSKGGGGDDAASSKEAGGVVSGDKKGSYDEGDEGDDDEEDEDEDFDGAYEDDEDYVPSGAMSAALRRALGLDVPEDADNVASDWKPPDFAGKHPHFNRWSSDPTLEYLYLYFHYSHFLKNIGLTNSDPLIRR